MADIPEHTDIPEHADIPEHWVLELLIKKADNCGYYVGMHG
jgi:hypothetical protein